MSTPTQARPSLTNVYLIDAAGVLAAVLYTVSNRTPPPLISLFLAIAPVVAVGLWFQRYLRHLRYAMPYDFGYFFMIGWPILIPVLARRLPLPNPWRTAAMLYALAVAPMLVAFAVNVMLYILE